MKFIYFTDPHLKGRNPARRLDDYPSEVLMFFQEAAIVAKKEKVTAVLIGGDLFDTPKISQRLYNKLARILKKFPCPVISVPGNHDIFGENPDSLEDTMLGSLEASGVIKLVSDDRPSIDFEEDGVTLAVHGKEYRDGRDEGDLLEDFTTITNSNTDWNFMLTHCMLLEKPFHPDVNFTLIKDAAQYTNMDVVFGAHFHPGWGIIEENNVVFIHPGSTARLEGTKVEATRTIQYAFIDVDSEGIFYELRPFQSARPGKDILDLTSNVQAKAHRTALDTFRKTVDDAIKFESHDPHDILKDLAAELVKQQQIKNHIPALAKQSLLDAEKDVDELNVGLKGFVEHNSQISIEWIELENFQAHRKTRFDFDRTGLNAIIGASDSGKTAAIRGLRWLLYNDPKGTDFIRFGESRATVRARFSNGVTLERSRTQSSAGHYKITDANGNETDYTGFGNNIPIEVTNAHQMPKTELAKDTEVSLNIAYQLDGPFLLSESASTRAGVIGRLTGVHVVDSAIKSTNKKVVGFQRDIKSEEKRVKDVAERLQNEFTDIAPLEAEVSQLELFISHAEKLEKKLESLHRIKKDYDTTAQIIKDSTQGLIKLAPILKAGATLSNAETKLVDMVSLLDIQEGLSRQDKIISNSMKELKQYRGMAKLANELSQAEEMVKERKALMKLDQQWEKNEVQLASFTKELKKLEGINSQALDLLDDKVQTLLMIKGIKRDIGTHEKTMEYSDEGIVDLNIEINDGREKYKSILKEMGKCPTCFTPVDDSIIDKIEL